VVGKVGQAGTGKGGGEGAGEGGGGEGGGEGGGREEGTRAEGKEGGGEEGTRAEGKEGEGGGDLGGGGVDAEHAARRPLVTLVADPLGDRYAASQPLRQRQRPSPEPAGTIEKGPSRRRISSPALFLVFGQMPQRQCELPAPKKQCIRGSTDRPGFKQGDTWVMVPGTPGVYRAQGTSV